MQVEPLAEPQAKPLADSNSLLAMELPQCLLTMIGFHLAANLMTTSGHLVQRLDYSEPSTTRLLKLATKVSLFKPFTALQLHHSLYFLTTIEQRVGLEPQARPLAAEEPELAAKWLTKARASQLADQLAGPESFVDLQP